MKQTLNYKAFSTAIRQRRIIDLDITVRSAAEKIGVSFATLSRCENCYMPDLITYANICKWLNVPMETFISKAKKV